MTASTDAALPSSDIKFQDARNLEQIRKSFYRDGIVFLEPCDSEDILAIGRSLGTTINELQELGDATAKSVVTSLDEIEDQNCQRTIHGDIILRTEFSHWDVPPRLLTAAWQPGMRPGNCAIFVDGYQVIEYIKLHDQELYSIITSTEHASFVGGDGDYKPFSVFDENSGILRLWLDPRTGMEISPSLSDCFEKLRLFISQHTFLVELRPGQSYIIDNHRYLHHWTDLSATGQLSRTYAHCNTKEPRKFVLFDIDGTLCTSPELSFGYQALSDVSGKPILQHNTEMSSDAETDLAHVRHMLEYHGISGTDLPPAIRRYLELHSQHIQRDQQQGGGPKFRAFICDGVIEFVTWLAEQRKTLRQEICISVLTGNSRANAMMKLQAAGIPRDMFDLDIAAFGDLCPSRLSLFQVVRRNIESKYHTAFIPSDVIIVGDTPSDVKCAKAVGCKVVAVASGNFTLDELKVHDPDIACNTLAEAKETMRVFLKGGAEGGSRLDLS